MNFQAETVEIITPSVFHIKHFGYILKNGVKCIIIQDPSATVPCAAMNIRVGQLNDPDILPGLAHFCEHMLFMGTDKYPGDGEYNEYIEKNGGRCNAWTSDRETIYYFTVAHEALEGALERFLEFFVAPTFNSSALSREVKAVHSEDEKNHSVEYWRVHELERSFVNPQHPKSRYGNGNITTLWDEPLSKNIDIRKRLVEFFNSYYVAGAACLAVYSALPPELVLRMIEGPLSRMRVGKPAEFRFLPSGDSFYSTEAKSSWINIRTIRKIRSLKLLWCVKCPASSWRTMPLTYISHILGHECNSSVFGILRSENLATEMFVGPQCIDDDNELLSVNISLTMDGLKRVIDVIDLVYQGIGLAARVDSTVYAQMKAEMWLHFESSSVESNVDHCAELALGANKRDLRHCWIGDSVVLDDDIAATEACIAQLIPENCIVELCWGEMPCDNAIVTDEEIRSSLSEEEEDEEGKKEVNDHEQEEDDDDDDDKEENTNAEELLQILPDFARVACNSTTRFHKTKFSVSRIPSEVIGRWTHSMHGPYHNALSLPPVNPFLATDFTVYDSDNSHAVIKTFHTMYGVTLVRKDAGRYKSFTTSITWRGLSPCIHANPKKRFYTSVMIDILKDAIGEVSYFGLLAALENDIVLDCGGLTLTVTGPQHRILDIFFDIFEKMFTLETLSGSLETYNSYADKAVRSLESKSSQQPYACAMDRFSKAARVVMYTYDELLDAAASTSYSEYKEFVKDYLASGVYFECFVAGNVPSAPYMQDHLVNGVEKILEKLQVPPAKKESIPRFRDVYAFTRNSSSHHTPLLDVLSYPPFDVENPNTAVFLDIYVGNETPLLRSLCDCMNSLMSSTFFNSLRTREALGYIVFSRSIRMGGTAHLQFVVQSALKNVDAIYLLSRIIAFLEAVEANFLTLCNDDKVDTVIKGLIEVRRKLPDSVSMDCNDLSSRYLHPTGLDYKEEEIKALEEVNATMLKDFFLTRVANSAVSRTALAVIVNNKRSSENDVFALNNNSDDSKDYREISLPPLRPNEEELPSDNDKSTETVLQLPDFLTAPMSICVRKFTSPEEYHTGFPIVRDNSI
ncbi:putative peptidase, putative,metallo-peptidase, Clan ME, Family M16 [Trypanosoma theileri]|uniref:Putative peptidase, putative,metallo-peptidase, Clan ME, Family M16 n=1 Tax=Trypanosoma theileri TaxID=67003 RepID=A0A1X0NIF3_9TRYP|nr:putative peptidase, putative,metallo-peptidase, Clan ME, Family M16 [Trypanosoma theileri]ORC84466.1 putative peptidase, putative,metallo-peptidase, Clan ME, Family M16 [Trypanosoma theileri]